MCGIAACFGLSRSQTEDFLESARAALAHRGPDGSAARVLDLPDGRIVGLAHTRLSIIDLSPRAAQPMHAEDGRLWMVANGEIVNAPALRAELEAAGHRFTSACDVEVILHGYARWGDAVASRLAGFFAAVVVDRDAGRVSILQDPLGIKPLHESVPPGRWVASVPLAPRPTATPEGAAAFLATGRYPAASSAAALPGGSAPGSSRPEWEQLDLRTEVERTITEWCASDVPVAVALSGGLDSSVVAATLRRCRADAHAVCVQWSPADAGRDEVPAAQAMAERLGLPLTVTTARSASVACDLDALIESLPYPTCDGLNVGAAARAVADAGGKVLLVGTGADELFGGYAHARWFERLARRGPLLAAARVVLAACPLLASPRARWTLGQIATAADPRRATYDSLRALFPAETIARLVPAAGPAAAASRFEDRSLLQLELDHYLRGVLLPDADTFGMRHGVEVRPPFLDSRLVAQVVARPDWRRPGKRALARAFADLFPHGVPPKRTFQVPIGLWLRSGPLHHRVAAELATDAAAGGGTLDPEAVRRIWRDFLGGTTAVTGHALWGLVVLALWSHRRAQA